jgi:hypothetical protein
LRCSGVRPQCSEPHLKQIATRSAAYSKLRGDVLDLVADPSIAVGYFRRADTAFTALRGNIAEMSAPGRAGMSRTRSTSCAPSRHRVYPGARYRRAAGTGDGRLTATGLCELAGNPRSARIARSRPC